MNCFRRFVDIQQKHNAGRLADAILYFCDEIYKEQAFSLPFSYNDLAALIGTTRESVTRTIKDFVDGGLIELSNRDLRVKNYEMLKKISENG